MGNCSSLRRGFRVAPSFVLPPSQDLSGVAYIETFIPTMTRLEEQRKFAVLPSSTITK
jgi:hypothetical protein